MITDLVALIDERLTGLDAVMEAVLGSSHSDLDLYAWARYHLGWCDDRLQPMPPLQRRKHGGRRLRALLTILACESVGGCGRSAGPAGAAIEFIHNFSLILDDIQDNDAQRRHRPTVWKLWGAHNAINVAANMQALTNRAILRLKYDYPTETILRVFEVLTGTMIRMTEGQHLDMTTQDVDELSLTRYFDMVEGKTASLMSAALRVGALLGTDDERLIESLAAFGRQLGLAFQCRDDYQGIWAHQPTYGKPVGSDLSRGKRSLPVVGALMMARTETTEGQLLREALRSRNSALTMQLLQELGLEAWTRAQVAEQVELAFKALERADRQGAMTNALTDIARYALGEVHALGG